MTEDNKTKQEESSTKEQPAAINNVTISKEEKEKAIRLCEETISQLELKRKSQLFYKKSSDEYIDAESCTVCEYKFAWFRRYEDHVHCYICGSSFCATHAPKTTVTLHSNGGRTERVAIRICSYHDNVASDEKRNSSSSQVIIPPEGPKLKIPAKSRLCCSDLIISDSDAEIFVDKQSLENRQKDLDHALEEAKKALETIRNAQTTNAEAEDVLKGFLATAVKSLTSVVSSGDSPSKTASIGSSPSSSFKHEKDSFFKSSSSLLEGGEKKNLDLL